MPHERDPMDLPPLWRVTMVAKYFRVHRITVQRWIKSGEVIRPDEVVRLGNRVRVKREAIERIVRERQRELRDA